MGRELPANDRVVVSADVLPRAVADLGRSCCGLDDVGEQHRREPAQSVVDGARACAGEELLKLGDEGSSVPEPVRKIAARELDHPSIQEPRLDLRHERLDLIDVGRPWARQDQCWRPDGREDVVNLGFPPLLVHGERRSRACDREQVCAPRSHGRRVARDRRRRSLQVLSRERVGAPEHQLRGRGALDSEGDKRAALDRSVERDGAHTLRMRRREQERPTAASRIHSSPNRQREP